MFEAMDDSFRRYFLNCWVYFLWHCIFVQLFCLFKLTINLMLQNYSIHMFLFKLSEDIIFYDSLILTWERFNFETIFESSEVYYSFKWIIILHIICIWFNFKNFLLMKQNMTFTSLLQIINGLFSWQVQYLLTVT